VTDWPKLNQFLQAITPSLGEYEEKVILTEADLKDAPLGHEVGDVIRVWKPAKLCP
jgi:hypothetical protein